MTKLVVNDASVVSYKCEMLFRNTVLACGTCFFFRYDARSYLVSNWHNFSGRDPRSVKPSSDHAGIPDEIGVLLPQRGKLGFSNCVKFRLAMEDGRNLWLQHPLKNQVDVAALEVSIPQNVEPRYVNELKLDPWLELEIGGDVFVVGYPRGITVAETLPIWKRASLASEPAINIDSLPKLLIDTATREGMSGSPVFARGNYVAGSLELTGDSEQDNRPWRIAYTYTLIGIYSGRVGDDSFLAQLGVVWKTVAIETVIKNGVVANNIA